MGGAVVESWALRCWLEWAGKVILLLFSHITPSASFRRRPGSRRGEIAIKDCYLIGRLFFVFLASRRVGIDAHAVGGGCL